MRTPILPSLFALSWLSQLSQAAPANPTTPDLANTSIQARKVFDVPLGVWVENLNTRQNGQVIIGTIALPEIYQVNPDGDQDGILLHRFYGYKSVYAIVQTQKDLFYASVGNWSLQTFLGTKGSWNIWEIDLRGVGTNKQISECQIKAESGSQSMSSTTTSTASPCGTPIVRVVAELPQLTLPDGIDVLNAKDGILITGDADSTNGQLYTINVNTGKVTPTYANIAFGDNTTANLLGIDGIKYVNNTLYYSNPSRKTFGKAPLSPTTGKATGKVSVLYNTSSTQLVDDFIFDQFGNLYATDVTGGLQYAKHPVGSTNLAAFAKQIPGTTATRFGQGPGQKSTLFVTNNGGIDQYLSGNYTNEGGLWAVEVSTLMV